MSEGDERELLAILLMCCERQAAVTRDATIEKSDEPLRASSLNFAAILYREGNSPGPQLSAVLRKPRQTGTLKP